VLLIVGAILFLACLPFLLLALILFRPFIVGAGAGVILVIALYTLIQPDARARLCAEIMPRIKSYRGIRFARDVAIDRGHSWASVDDDVTVGADDFVQAILGPVDTVRLPIKGGHVERGRPLFGLVHGDRSLELPSPVSGTVVGVNTELFEHPELINQSPFDDGWIAIIHADHLQDDRRDLMVGKEARRWMHEQIDSLIGVLPSSETATEESPERLYRRIDPAAWEAMRESVAHPSGA